MGASRGSDCWAWALESVETASFFLLSPLSLPILPSLPSLLSYLSPLSFRRALVVQLFVSQVLLWAVWVLCLVSDLHPYQQGSL